tara:strand:- start:74112 stop:75350 length:1239 start_codon:yes stop_codon:yes gene_type:complete
MVIAAIGLSQVSILIDRNVGASWMSDSWWASMNQPDGARALLATVAGSMITVAGVTFSLTILAVSHATSHFGPRLLDNFMRDRGNQITLGTFVATFLYCLLVLRAVRGGDAVSDDGLQIAAFVPQWSLTIALAMTLSSVAVLIYFIHHIPESIHIANVLRNVAADMHDKIDVMYPEMLGDPLAKKSRAPDSVGKVPIGIVRSAASGYLQGIDDVDLLSVAKDYRVVLRLLKRPGEFICRNEHIADVLPAGFPSESGNSDDKTTAWPDDASVRVQHGFTIGNSRTPTQDVFFIMHQFVEVAIRALSPGVNDPFTAMQCIDWLCSGLLQLSEREIPSQFRVDEKDELRVITTDLAYRDFIETTLGQLIFHVKGDPNVVAYFKDSCERVCKTSENRQFNRLIRDQVDSLLAQAKG